ncbi:hypothetical protein [Hyphomicrobium sp.]|uniref:hypothetical protein n=1 Tax=Hyphomicrobium sp. TaxID=82 RepID=UPI000FA91092|nr:hypothetical protein [Hyphomicrobium sp.]RUP10298.1 MAG: hypothetical protein EKK38_07695 [Hyphomicrobium sp.]
MIEAAALFNQAMSFDKSGVGENFLDVARTLRDLFDHHPDRFQKFIKVSSLGRRKIYYLVAIDRAFRKLKISKGRVINIGWTKAHLLAKHINPTNANKLLELAEENSAHNLKIILAGGEKKDNLHAVLHYMDDELYEKYEKALLKFGAQKGRNGGLTGKEEALLKLIKKVK